MYSTKRLGERLEALIFIIYSIINIWQISGGGGGGGGGSKSGVGNPRAPPSALIPATLIWLGIDPKGVTPPETDLVEAGTLCLSFLLLKL